MEKGTIQECVGCGFCCLQAPCGAAVRLWKGAKPCPGLEWNGESQMHRCTLMEIPGLVGEQYRKELYAGAGCCSNMNSWRREKVVNRIPHDPVYEPISKPFQIFLAALGSEMISGDKIILMLGSFESRMKKANYNPEFIQGMKKAIGHYILQQRNSHFEKFIGGLSYSDIEKM